MIAPSLKEKSSEVEAMVQSTLMQAQMIAEQKTVQEDEENRPVRVLSLDGGGIRGVGVAEILNVLETKIKTLTGKHLYEFFDLIVGTSTGGIIATALGMGVNGSELVDIYKEDAKEIFDNNKRWFGGIDRAKYNSDGLKKIIKKRVCDKKMKDAKTHIAVTAYDDEHREVFLFTNEVPKATSVGFEDAFIPGGELNITKALRATSAAPSFFKGKVISEGDLLGDSTKKGEKRKLVDGGIAANNPTMLASLYAKRLLRSGAFGENHKHKIQMVSIGTGEAGAIVLDRDAGMFGFGSPANIPTFFMDGAAACGKVSLREEARSGKASFRLQFGVDKADLDNTSPEYINMLISQAHKVTETEYFDQMLQMLCGQTVKKVFTAEAALAA